MAASSILVFSMKNKCHKGNLNPKVIGKLRYYIVA